MFRYRTSARYDDLGRIRGFNRKSANAVYESGKSGVDAAVNRAAERLVDVIVTNTMSLPAVNPEEAKAKDRAAESWTTVDAGMTFKRRNIYAGSLIRVALVSPEDGAYSAALLEYGGHGVTGGFPATKAVFEMGGLV